MASEGLVGGHRAGDSVTCWGPALSSLFLFCASTCVLWDPESRGHGEPIQEEASGGGPAQGHVVINTFGVPTAGQDLGLVCQFNPMASALLCVSAPGEIKAYRRKCHAQLVVLISCILRIGTQVTWPPKSGIPSHCSVWWSHFAPSTLLYFLTEDLGVTGSSGLGAGVGGGASRCWAERKVIQSTFPVTCEWRNAGAASTILILEEGEVRTHPLKHGSLRLRAVCEGAGGEEVHALHHHLGSWGSSGCLWFAYFFSEAMPFLDPLRRAGPEPSTAKTMTIIIKRFLLKGTRQLPGCKGQC